MNVGYIYKHTSPSGLSYIGKSLAVKGKRWKEHVKRAYDETSKEYNYPLQRAIRKYGEEHFVTEILEDNVPEDILAELEVLYIEKYDTFYNGYNQTKGGEGTSGERSEEAKAAIAKANKERVWDNEMRQKMSEIKTGVCLEPWFIKYPDGTMEVFTNLNKAEYALSKGYHVGSFKNLFREERKGVVVAAGKFKGYEFGNLKDLQDE